MIRKNKFFKVSFIIVLGVGLSYFFINTYIDDKYVGRLPNVPDLNETSVSFRKNIEDIHTNTMSKPSAKNLGELGMIYHANNYFEEANVCYLLAVERNPKKWEMNYYLGCLNRKLGNSEEAINNFNKVLEVQPNMYMALYYKAEALNLTGSTSKSEEIFKKISKLAENHFVLDNTKINSYFPLSVYASLELAKLYVSTDKVEMAESQLKLLISNEISFGPAYRQLSIIYADKGAKGLSKYYSDRSKDLEDYTSPVDTLLNKLHFYSRSETYLLKQIEDAIRSNNLLWALELVEYSLKKVPESKYIVSKAVRLYISMNMARKTLPYLAKHQKAFQDDYKELVDIGKGLSNSGLKSASKKYFMAAEKCENEKPETKSRLAGIFYDRLGMKTKALQMMEELLDQNPNDPAVIGGATFLSIQTGDMVTAKKHLMHLKKIDAKNPRINVFKGIIAKKVGDTKAALGYYQLAFKDAPDQGFIVKFLSEYYKNNNMWSELADLYKNALKFSPNNPNLQEAYGSFLINCPNKQLQDPKLAREFSERALVNYKSDVQIQVAAGQSLAMSYFQLNDKAKALFYIRKTINVAKQAGFSKEYIASLKTTFR